MPTYDYRCDACDHGFEEFQSMTEEPLKKCPECGKKKLRRLFGSGAAILFKGSGFYQTDYRSESYKAGAKADAKPDAKSEAGKSSDKPAGDGATGTSGTTESKGSGKTESGAKSGTKTAKSGK